MSEDVCFWRQNLVVLWLTEFSILQFDLDQTSDIVDQVAKVFTFATTKDCSEASASKLVALACEPDWLCSLVLHRNSKAAHRSLSQLLSLWTFSLRAMRKWNRFARTRTRTERTCTTHATAFILHLTLSRCLKNQQKVEVLISSYLDNPEVLARLLEVHDKMEHVVEVRWSKYRHCLCVCVCVRVRLCMMKVLALLLLLLIGVVGNADVQQVSCFGPSK